MEMVSLMYSTPTVFVPQRRILCMSSNLKNTELLRTQLHQLHTEAEKTRDKASNARLRLMRLSEAAEKLQRQAAVDVRTGREDEARELLFQKRKVMQALDKSKYRIEMLDDLLAKLNEAISVKEKQLIGYVSSGLVGRETTSNNVRIVPPKEKNPDTLDEGQDTESVIIHSEDQAMQSLDGYSPEIPFNYPEEDIAEGVVSTETANETELVSNLRDISSYKEFLKHLDKQLSSVELDLVTFLRLSTLVLESEEKPKNSKVQQAKEILEDVQRIRKRVASITKMKVGIN